MENFTYKIEDYADSLKPSLRQKESMYVKVFNQNPGKSWEWIKSLAISPASLGAYVLVGALVLPLAYVGISNPNRVYDFDSVVRLSGESNIDKSKGFGGSLGGMTAEEYAAYKRVAPSYSLVDTYYNIVPTEDTSTPQGERIVDRDGELVVEAYNPAEILQQLKGLVSREGGYIMSSNLSSASGRAVAQIRLQVPVEKFEIFLAEISRMPITVVSENISLRDVQNQYSNYEELKKGVEEKIKKAEQQYNQAKTAAEKEVAKKELDSLKQQKEGIETNMENLAKGVAMSSLFLEIRSLSGFNLLGRTWSSWQEVGQFLANFWGQVLILAAPAALILAVIFRKRVWRFVSSKIRFNWK